VLTALVAAGIGHPAIHATLGHMQFDDGDYPAAEQSFRRVMELCSSHRRAPFNLAMTLVRMGRLEDASAWFERAYETDPARLDALLFAGACLVHAKLPARALDVYQQALLRKPDRQEALFGKAVCLQQCGRFGEAIEFYERVLSADPRHEGALTNLAVLREQLQ
jgi:tetratricopeptide (TPR) repeat protein